MSNYPNQTVLTALQQRNAASKLQSPGPNAAELEEIFKAAVRAPDHALLRPWRFLTIQDQGLVALGDLLVKVSVANAQHKGESLSEEQQEKIRSKPMRAPLIIAVIAKISEHPKVPEIEQVLSAGCAAQNILLAVEALGYAAIWRTGDLAFDQQVWQGLGLAGNEQLLGFLYVGTRLGDKKPLPEHDLSAFVTNWP